MSDRLPPPVRVAIAGWLDVFDRAAPGVVEGLYVVGSAALDDWQPRSDIDVVAFVADPTDADVAARLEAAHDEYQAKGGRPTVDGPHLSWADISSPPLAALRPWSLDGEFHVDGECFEINPVTWYTLATHGLAIRGEPSAELGVHIDEGDRRHWVRANVDTYWRAVRDQIVDVLAINVERNEFDAGMTEWCALGIARMGYTFETGGVAAKSAAGGWAADRFPDHADVLRSAVEIRHDLAPGPVDRVSVETTVALMTAVIDAVTASA